MQFVFLLKPAKDRDCILHRWFADEHRLETPLQRRVFFNMLLIFIERRRADAMQFAARQSGLDEVRGVHRAFALARANQSVHLVNEQNDIALGLFDLVKHAFQPLLEFAPIFRPCD